MSHSAVREISAVSTAAAVLTAAATAAAVAVDAAAVAVVVAIAGLVLAWGWPWLFRLPSAGGVQGVLSIAVLAAVLTAQIADERGMQYLPVVSGAALLLAFLHQLVRTDGRHRLVASLAGTAFGLGILGSGVFYLAAVQERIGEQTSYAALAAAGVGALIDKVWHRRPGAEWVVPTSMLLGGLIGIGIALTADVSWAALLLVGVFSAAVAHSIRRLLALTVVEPVMSAKLAIGIAGTLSAGVLAYAGAWLYR